MTRRPRHPKPTLEQNIGRNIRRAASIIEDTGWIRGSDGNKEKGFCMRGALRYAVPNGDEFYITLKSLDQWLSNVYNGACVVGYNDAAGRTKDEVLFIMRKCADELDPGIRPRETS